MTLFDYGPEKLDNVNNTYNSTDNSGINSGHTLKFYSYGTSGSTINNFTDGAYANQGIVKPLLDSNGYPVVTTSNESLKYLFDENNIGGGAKTTYTNVNHLFQRDEDGFLYYDSDENYAYYNQSTHNFSVYEDTFWEEGADSDNPFFIGFFPFNDYDSRYKCIHGNNFNWGCKGSKDRNVRDQVGHYNHHFGLKLEGTFEMPYDKQANGKDIFYYFSGDDDMWLFVDGVLVLDIGGVHNPVSGSVNFTTGEVNVSAVKTASGCSSSALGASTTIAEAFRKAGKEWDDSPFSTHEVKIFYMERGGMYSNLAMEFNFPLFKPIDLTITKKNGDLETPLPEVVFGLYSSPDCLESDQIKRDEVHLTATSDSYGNVTFQGLKKGRIYYIKELSVPSNIKKDDTVYAVKALDGENHVKIYAYDEDNPDEPEQGIDSIINYEKTYASFTFAKVDSDEQIGSANRLLANAQFTLYTDKECRNVAKNKNDVEMKDISSNPQGQVTFSEMLAPGTYYFKETKEPDGYVRNNNLYKVVFDETRAYVVYKVEGTEEETLSTGNIEIPNTPKNQKTSVSVEKEWSDGNRNHKNDSIKVQLYKKYIAKPTISYTVKVDPWKNGTPSSGEVVATITGNDGNTYTVTLNSGNGWTATQNDLPSDATYSVTGFTVSGDVGMVSIADTTQDSDGNYTTTLDGWKHENITLTVVADKYFANNTINNQKPPSRSGGYSGKYICQITGSNGATYNVEIHDGYNPSWQNSITVPRFVNGEEITYTCQITSFDKEQWNLTGGTIYGENQIRGASGTFHILAYGPIPNNTIRLLVEPVTMTGNWSISGDLYTTWQDHSLKSYSLSSYGNKAPLDISYNNYSGNNYFLSINDSYDDYEVESYYVGEDLAYKGDPEDHTSYHNVLYISPGNNTVTIKLRKKATLVSNSNSISRSKPVVLNSVRMTDPSNIVDKSIVLDGTPVTDLFSSDDGLGIAVLDNGNNWTHTWTGLSTLEVDPSDGKEKNVVYYVKEIEADLEDEDANIIQAEYEYVYNEEGNPDSGVKSVKVKNTVYGTTSIEVTKAWYGANGSTPYIPNDSQKTITFDVYQIVDESDTVISANQTITYDNGWPVVSVENLPVMVKVGNELKPATYYVVETSPLADEQTMTTYYKGDEGNRTTEPKDLAGATHETIINVNGSKDLKITKQWLFEDGGIPTEANHPTESTVYFKLKKPDGSFYKEENNDLFELHWTEENGWEVKEFSIDESLYLYIIEVDSHGNPIEDSERNGTINISYKDADGNEVDSEHPFQANNGGTYTITNTQKRTSLYAEKIWWGTNRYNLAGDNKIWFELRRVQTDGNTVISGTDELVQVFYMNESGNWIKYFDNLLVAPFSENITGQTRYYQYYIKELGFRVEQNTDSDDNDGNDDGSNDGSHNTDNDGNGNDNTEETVEYTPVSNDLKIYYQSRGTGTSNGTEYQDYSSGTEFATPDSESWLTSDVIRVQSWEDDYDGNGMLGVFNSSYSFRNDPVTITKKWYEQNGSNWVDISDQDGQKDLTVEIQLMQEATFPYDNPTTTVDVKYGSTFTISKNDVIKQSDTFIVNNTGTAWSFEIPGSITVDGSVRKQLPERGAFKYEDHDYVADFKYYVSEYKVYDGENNDVTSNWSAACFSTDGKSFEIDNRKTTDLTAHKKWKDVPSHFLDTNVKAILFKVWRQEGEETEIDFTDTIGRDPEAYGLTEDDVEIITTTTGEGEEQETDYDTYLKLVPGTGSRWSNDTTLTVQNLAAFLDNYSDITTGDKTIWPKYKYWIEELKYIDGSDKVNDISELYGTGEAPTYSSSANGPTGLSAGTEIPSSDKLHLAGEGKTHYQITNTAKGLIKIQKVWTDNTGKEIEPWLDDIYLKVIQIRKLATDESEVLEPIDYPINDQTVLRMNENEDWSLVLKDLPLTTVIGEKTYNCYYQIVELEKITDGVRTIYIPTSSATYDGNDGADSDVIPISVVNVKPSLILKIFKTDAESEDEKLSGAEFRIKRKMEDNSFQVFNYTGLENGKFTIDDAEEGVIFNGLPAGLYQIEELSAPSGYLKTLNPIVFEITIDGRVVEPGKNTKPSGDLFSFEYSISESADELIVKNQKGAELPATGGEGEVIFYTIGALLTTLASITLLLKRKSASI